MIRRARRERALVHPRFDRFEVRGGEDAVEPGDGAAAMEAVARIDNAVVRAKIGEAAAARAPFVAVAHQDRRPRLDLGDLVQDCARLLADRKSGGQGKGGHVRVKLGGCGYIKKKKKKS